MRQNQPILLLSSPYFLLGGLKTYLTTVINGFSQCGWELHLLITDEINPNFDDIQSMCTCHDISSTPQSWKKVRLAADLVNKISPSVLLMNHCSLMHYTLPLIEKRIKPVAVLHSNDFRFYFTATKFKSRIFRWITPSQKLADTCQKHIGHKYQSKVRLIPHGIDAADFFYSPDKFEIMPSIWKIAYVASIDKHKGADILPDIIKLIANERSNIHVYIIGDGPYKELIENKFKENNLSEKCTFTGAVSHKQVAQYLLESHIFLLPTNLEGFGLSIIEAMMSGTIPVVSRLQGITDGIIEDGITGLLVEPKDINGFAHAVIELMGNEKRMIKIATLAREMAIKNFTQEVMLNAYKNVFSEKDDRGKNRQAGIFGWFLESSTEMLRKEFVKYSLR